MKNNDAQLDFLIKKMAEDHRPELPSLGVIWWRAQIQKKLAEKESIERPMVIMRLLATVLCAAVVAGMLVANARLLLTLARSSAPLSILLGIAAVSVFAAGITALLRSSLSRT
jgi:hypothetical protein